MLYLRVVIEMNTQKKKIRKENKMKKQNLKRKADKKKKTVVWKIALTSVVLLISLCKSFSAWADMVYRRSTVYTNTLKELKKVFDPNNILNPGKLCY